MREMLPDFSFGREEEGDTIYGGKKRKYFEKSKLGTGRTGVGGICDRSIHRNFL